MQIYPHRVGTALDWLGTGLRLFAKQWSKFLLLFMTLFLGMGMVIALPDFLLLIISVLSVPMMQMVLFNAAHGTAIRGHFKLSDLIKKIDTPLVWMRFFIAGLLNTLALYAITQLTFPSLPLSMEQLNTMTSIELAQYASQHLSMMSLIPGFLSISLFLLCTAWVFPLLSWESMSLLDAYRHSFKASIQNILPLIFLWILLVCIMLLMFLFPQYIALYFVRDLSVFYLLMFFAINTISVILHTCQYASYIGIFFEPDKTPEENLDE